MNENCTPGYISKENGKTNLKKYMYPSVQSSIVYNRNGTEETQVSINRWMDKEDHSGIKKKWNLSFETTWMHLECIMLSEITHIKKNSPCIIYMWNLKIKQKNKYNKTKIVSEIQA